MSAQIISLAARRAERVPQPLVDLSADHRSIVRAFAPWDGKQVRVKSTGELWEILGWNPKAGKFVLQRTVGAHCQHQQRRIDEFEEAHDSTPGDVA